MQLVEDTKFKSRKEPMRILRGNQKRQLLRSGQQNVRRIYFLTPALVDGRVSTARFQRDIQSDFSHRRGRISMYIDGKRFERRDIECVYATVRFTRPSLRTPVQA